MTLVLAIATGLCALLGLFFAAVGATVERVELVLLGVVFALLAAGGCALVIGA